MLRFEVSNNVGLDLEATILGLELFLVGFKEFSLQYNTFNI